jgi:hypothetical protein
MRKPSARRRRGADLPDPMQALSVYDGSRCIGFIMPRGKSGVEAFDGDTRSLGVFPDQKSAGRRNDHARAF